MTPTTPRHEAPDSQLRQQLHEIIFEAETPAGKAFDVALLVAILVSVASEVLDSVKPFHAAYGKVFQGIDWTFTGLFTVEYALRLYAVKRPLRYALSFYGFIDLAAVLPTYVSVLVPGAQSFSVVRAFRLLRAFRIFKLVHFLGEASVLMRALRSSVPKITVFLGAVMIVVVVVGAAMYFVEGEESGYDSIPRGMYWAIVTVTTVGYGDITPHTVTGQVLAALLMIAGYGVLAVPTGIVSVELANAGREHASTVTCPECAHEGHDPEARFCMMCGSQL